MKIGDTVYTVNAKTNTVDEWTFSGGYIPGFAYLTKGSKTCFIPTKCVFETKEKAEKVAKL